MVFVYKNQWLRKMRADNVDATVMISQLANPPQGDEYRELFGETFPE